MWGWIIGGVVLLLASATNENNNQAERTLRRSGQKRDQNQQDLEMKFKVAGKKNYEAILKTLAKIAGFKEANIKQLYAELDVLAQRVSVEKNAEMKKNLRKQVVFLRRKLRHYN